MLVAIAEFEEQLVLGRTVTNGSYRQPRSPWLLEAGSDGTVVGYASDSLCALIDLADFEQVVLGGWRELAPLAARLGDYGPANLTVGVFAAQPSARGVTVTGEMATAALPAPEHGTRYRGLPQHTWMRRWTTVDARSDDTLRSLRREFDRATGRPAFENEAAAR